MLPKKGKFFPTGENLGSYRRAIAYALKQELGSTHQAVKTAMAWTGAGERTVKNWLAEIRGPSGEHLVSLVRHSDLVLQTVLVLAGRQHVADAQNLLELRNRLAETVHHIDASLHNDQPVE